MSEILAFSESSGSAPKLSTEPVSEPEANHTVTDVPPQEDAVPESDSHETTSEGVSEQTVSESASEPEDSSSAKGTDTSDDFSDSQADSFAGKEKNFHQRRFFHTAKELNYLREKYILEKIPDDQLLEYLKLEEKRHELQVQERNIREKRIMNTFMLTVILAAIVAVIYSLHENPTVLISILYIGGILAGIHVWNKKK